jgi:thiol-disulfide isomerase/thioredoxin
VRLRSAHLVRVAAAVAVALVAAGCTSATSGQGESDTGFVSGSGTVITVDPADRKDAPDVSGERLGGGELSLADFRGQVAVLNVWASWCAPCRAEAPGLNRAARNLAKDDVAFVGLNTKDSEASAIALEKVLDTEYPSFSDPSGVLQLRLRDSIPPRAVPSTLVFDREGRVASGVIGPVTQEQLESLVQDVLAEDAADATPEARES